MKRHQDVLESDEFRLTRRVPSHSYASRSLSESLACSPSPLPQPACQHVNTSCINPLVSTLVSILSARQHLVSTSRRISPLLITSKHHGNIKKGDIIKTPHINTPHKTRSNKPFRYQQVVVKLQHSTFNAYPACARIFVSGTVESASFDMSALDDMRATCTCSARNQLVSDMKAAYSESSPGGPCCVCCCC